MPPAVFLKVAPTYEMVIDPHNPRKNVATTWDLELKTLRRASGRPGSGIHVTMDGGDTWRWLQGKGLPTRALGKIAVCMSAGDSDRIYTLIETGDGVPINGEETDTGELWRSDAPHEVYFLSSSFSWSTNWGESHTTVRYPLGGNEGPPRHLKRSPERKVVLLFVAFQSPPVTKPTR